jgi:hypothetical protein
LDFRYGDVSKAMALAQSGHVQVGTISVTNGGDSFTDEIKLLVQPKACQMGGSIVMMASSSEGSFGNYPYVSLMVFRETAPQP